MNDDIQNSDNGIDKKITNEEYDNGNNKGSNRISQNEETYKEDLEKKQEDLSKKDQASSQKSGAYFKEENDSEKKIQTDKENKMNDEEKTSVKKSQRSFGVGLIALMIALAILVTGLFSAVGLVAVDGIVWVGRFIHALTNSNSGYEQTEVENNSPIGDMNVIKNDGSIKVNEQLGSTGYTDGMTISQVVDLVADTVVEIKTSHVVNDRFYGQYVTSGAGSGVIITENGYIITNHHVIEGAREITVRLTDGKEYAAKLIGADEEKDIAVVKISANGLPFAVMGSSKDLVVGQDVIAIGNPLGSLGGTVTDGIISALDRTVVVGGHRMTLMQTNAAINPGNSGGGLFDMSGQLIGIVNAKQSDTGIEGLGFAIPIDVAWNTVKDIVEGKH